MVKARWVNQVPDVLAAERAGMRGSPALEVSSARGTLDRLRGHPVPRRVRRLLSSQRGPGCPLESPGSFKTAASGPTCKDSLSNGVGQDLETLMLQSAHVVPMGGQDRKPLRKANSEELI